MIHVGRRFCIILTKPGIPMQAVNKPLKHWVCIQILGHRLWEKYKVKRKI